MANLAVKNGDGVEKFLKTSGVGSDGDPHIPDHTTTLNAGTALAGKVGIDQVSANANEVVVKSGTVTAVTAITNALPAGTNLLGKVGIDQATANANEVVVKSGTVTAVTAITNALPAGTNAIGKLSANSGVDIGDVDVLSIAAGDNNIGNVDIASIAAGETHIGEIGAPDDCITITCSLAAATYTAGDVLFATQEIANAVRVNGDTCILQSLSITDIDDQKGEITLVFFNANTSLGTEESAPDIDDTELLTVIGHLKIETTDYMDLGTGSIATKSNIGMLLKAGAATTSLWVAGICTATPTHSASGLQLTLGLMRN